MTRSVEVWATWTYHGFHQWPDATGERAYLAHRHRHLFYGTASVAVAHDDREVEFHDLQAVCEAATRQFTEAGASSCEMMAAAVIDAISAEWPGRNVSVTISEDGECGATVHDWPPVIPS